MYTIKREDVEWTLDILPVKGQSRFSHMGQLRRNGEIWATGRLSHDGKLEKLMVAPYHKIPTDVWATVQKEFQIVYQKIVKNG